MKKRIKFIGGFLLLLSLMLIATNVYADEYPDDIYDGDYSLNEMLENYNIITFGKKGLDSKMNKDNFSKGDAKLFHINANFLVNGTLSLTEGTTFKMYPPKSMGRLDFSNTGNDLYSSVL